MAKGKCEAVLISGLPQSNGGVGRLMKNIIPLANKSGFLVVTRRESISLQSLLNGNKFRAILWEMFARAYDSIYFFIKTFFLKNKTILFVHPQTAGFGLLNRLIIRNKVYLYVMDNSFFCMRSYNVHPISRNECINCLGDPRRFDLECSPFPVYGSPNKMAASLKLLQKNAQKITFLAQNNNQAKLLRMHFGRECKITVVGMDSNELGKCSKFNKQIINYDLVFHGSAHLAKGVSWFVELTEFLPKLKFFMPCSKLEIEAVLNRSIKSSNITFSSCTWEHGLKDVVESAKLVCVPSLWSAPIEGALLKSIFFNGEVAVVKTKYGFSQEIDNGIVLHLSPDPFAAALEISNHLSSGNKFEEASRQWLKSFSSKNLASNLFKAIG